ncbi:hypothetical protein [Streptomyces sp. NPDC096033]|uniref:hypothetical protein n=1 Tax=Streptomyces sp. NPDC096033 TaxID=3366071 RepID=UPI00381A33EE
MSGWRHFCVNIGAALAGSPGGYLASTAGLPTLFWINACACALFGSAAVLLLPPRRTGPGREYSRSEPLPRPAWQPPVVALPGQPLCSHLRRQRLHGTADAHELRWSRRDRIRMDAGGQCSRRAPPFPLTIDEWPKDLLVELPWQQPRREDRDPVLAQLPAISA